MLSKTNLKKAGFLLAGLLVLLSLFACNAPMGDITNGEGGLNNPKEISSTPAPVTTYTLTYSYYSAPTNASPKSTSIPNLVYSSVVGISTSPTLQFPQGPGMPMVTIYFLRWVISSGTAVIANPTSPNTTVTGFTSNVVINPEYGVPPPTITPPTPTTYRLTYTYVSSATTAPKSTTIPDLTINSVVAISTSPTQLVFQGPGNPWITLYFQKWTIGSGTAVIADPTNPSTTVTGFKSDVVIYAEYWIPVTPTNTLISTPTNTPTATPVYRLTYTYLDSPTATPKTTTIPNLKQGSVVTISTSPTMLVSQGPGNPLLTLYFQKWVINSGTAVIASLTSPTTTVTGFASDVVIVPTYAPIITPSTTIRPTATPTNTVTPTASVLVFTCGVAFVNSSNTWEHKVYSNLTKSSVINISTASIFTANVNPLVQLKFMGWTISSGSATITNPNSSSTTVTNFSANTEIAAKFQ